MSKCNCIVLITITQRTFKFCGSILGRSRKTSCKDFTDIRKTPLNYFQPSAVIFNSSMNAARKRLMWTSCLSHPENAAALTYCSATHSSQFMKFSSRICYDRTHQVLRSVCRTAPAETRPFVAAAFSRLPAAGSAGGRRAVQRPRRSGLPAPEAASRAPWPAARHGCDARSSSATLW